MSEMQNNTPRRKGRPRKARVEQPVKLTYEQKKELKLQAQREKQANATEPANKDRFYCTNREMLAEMIKWRDSAKKPENRIISEELGKMMMMIAQKVLNRSEFRNYSKELKEDMASFGYYKIIRGLKNFDFRFTNCFSFFSTAFFNAYLTILKKHYKHINLRKDLTVKLLTEMETYPGMNASSSLAKVIKQYLDDSGSDDE